MEKIVEVVAALIWEGDTFLACRRPWHKARGGLWEFVGGKVEEGETGEEALVRECKEELAIDIAPKGVYAVVVHEYPDITIRLTLYNATIRSGEIRLLEHIEYRFITPSEIDELEFCPADEEILKKLKGAKPNRS